MIIKRMLRSNFNTFKAISHFQIGSRYVIQITGLILILMALLGKIGAVLCLITEPIIGGMATISLAAILGGH